MPSPRKLLKIGAPLLLLGSALFAAFLWLEGLTAAGFFGRIIYDDVPPSEYPVTLIRNKTIVIPIRIYEKRLYVAELKLKYNSELEQTAVEAILGSGYSTEKERGIPTTFKIKLKTQNNDTIFETKKISNSIYGSSTSQFMRRISRFVLDRGNYIL